MPYRLTLTTEDGEVLSTWKVVNDPDIERDDDTTDISRAFACIALTNEIAHEIDIAEERR